MVRNLSFDVTLFPEALVFIWISSTDAVNVTEAGFPIVPAASDDILPDRDDSGWIGADPTGNSWCDSYDSLTHLITSAQKPLATGGEAHL